MSCACMAKNEFALSKIRALFACEGIDFYDKQSALKSLSETCLPTKLTRIYLEELQHDLRKKMANN